MKIKNKSKESLAFIVYGVTITLKSGEVSKLSFRKEIIPSLRGLIDDIEFVVDSKEEYDELISAGYSNIASDGNDDIKLDINKLKFKINKIIPKVLKSHNNDKDKTLESIFKSIKDVENYGTEDEVKSLIKELIDASVTE